MFPLSLFYRLSVWPYFYKPFASTVPLGFLLDLTYTHFKYRSSRDVIAWNTKAALITTQTMASLSHFQLCPMERLSSTH